MEDSSRHSGITYFKISVEEFSSLYTFIFIFYVNGFITLRCLENYLLAEVEDLIFLIIIQ